MSIKFDIKYTAKTTLDQLKTVQQQLANIPHDAYNYWRSITPIDTGNARRSTSLSNRTIHANYPYADRLDKGWSKQYGGKGMTKPTTDFIQKRVKQITGK
jgi:hypothetical protein